MMFLWLLTPTQHGADQLNSCDTIHGNVVRAKSPVTARRYAALYCSNEGPAFWKDRNLVSCKRLKREGEEGIVLQDIRGA